MNLAAMQWRNGRRITRRLGQSAEATISGGRLAADLVGYYAYVRPDEQQQIMGLQDDRQRVVFAWHDGPIDVEPTGAVSFRSDPAVGGVEYPVTGPVRLTSDGRLEFTLQKGARR